MIKTRGPTRARTLAAVLEAPRTCTELEELLHKDKTTLRYHLNALRDEGKIAAGAKPGRGSAFVWRAAETPAQT